MAFENGTASNYLDLLAKIVTFASANGWTVLEQSSTQVYMRGAGASGLDEIYAGIRAYEVTASNRYNFELYGSWGYVAGKTYNSMPMAAGPMSGKYVYTYLWNSEIPYWLSVTGRRIICVAKVNTVYQHIHLGFINPPATNNQYPYPLLIGGCGSTDTYNYATTSDVTAYWAYNGSTGSGNLSLPGGGWGKISTDGSSATLVSLNSWSPIHAKKSNIITCPDDTYMLFPIYVLNTDFPEIYGQIDGLFQISGYNNASENTLTIDGVEYVVFQDIHRATYGVYCAMRCN